MTFVHTAWPYKPAGVTAVQMNLFYGLAMIALHRDASVRRYSEAGLADSTAMAFMRRITAFEDPDLEAMGAAFRHACRLEVATKDGPILRHERLARRGSPEDAVGSADTVRKFEVNVSGILEFDAAVELRETVDRLDRLADSAELARQLALT